MKRLLEHRAMIKKKKPRFFRQDAHKIKRIGKSWRKARGVDSKVGRGVRGYRRKIKIGWGSPKQVRGMHKSGLKFKMVNSTKELADVDPKSEIVVIGSTVGTRKKVMIIKEALEKNLRVLNYKDPQKFLDETDNKRKKIKERKVKKEKIKKEKEKKKEKPKKSIEETVETDKEKKDREKKEKDKVLTKKTK